MDNINQIWPKWHTVELLGRGAFGDVYKVKREELGEVFYSAVKVIRIPREDQEIKELLNEGHTSQSIQNYYESIARGLMGEIKTMETLKSAANVVGIEEFEVRERMDGIGWEAYIRMELLKNLNEYRAGRTLSREEIVRLGKDICQALICCEKNQIIHRDIKPSNIFVDFYGQFKLGDFGISRQMERTQSTLSQKGTEAYMAPEIRRGEQGSYNVDLYSLGLVLYRLLNRNKMPFEPMDKELSNYQEKEIALARRLQGEKLPLPADADPALGEIVCKACAFDKKDRYQNAQEMRETLKDWENGKHRESPIVAGESSEKPAERRSISQDVDEEKTVGVFRTVPQEKNPEEKREEDHEKGSVIGQKEKKEQKTDQEPLDDEALKKEPLTDEPLTDEDLKKEPLQEEHEEDPGDTKKRKKNPRMRKIMIAVMFFLTLAERCINTFGWYVVVGVRIEFVPFSVLAKGIFLWKAWTVFLVISLLIFFGHRYLAGTACVGGAIWNMLNAWSYLRYHLDMLYYKNSMPAGLTFVSGCIYWIAAVILCVKIFFLFKNEGKTCKGESIWTKLTKYGRNGIR